MYFNTPVGPMKSQTLLKDFVLRVNQVWLDCIKSLKYNQTWFIVLWVCFEMLFWRRIRIQQQIHISLFIK